MLAANGSERQAEKEYAILQLTRSEHLREFQKERLKAIARVGMNPNMASAILLRGDFNRSSIPNIQPAAKLLHAGISPSQQRRLKFSSFKTPFGVATFLDSSSVVGSFSQAIPMIPCLVSSMA